MRYIIFLVIIVAVFGYFYFQNPTTESPYATQLDEKRIIREDTDQATNSPDIADENATTTVDTASANAEPISDSSDVPATNDGGQANIQEGADEVAPGPSVPVGNQKFVTYTNKAIGYTINRPDKWYWQHFMRTEIAGSNPNVDDYFIADRNPLPGLTSEYLGEIVIEVSRRDLTDFSDGIIGFSKKNVTVGGAQAVRYEGSRNGQTVIEYHFTHNNRTFRIMYTKIGSTEEEKTIFETVVSSFIF